MNFFEKYLGGSFTVKPFGFRVTVFGFNAMHVAVEISAPKWNWGYLVIHPTVRCFGKWWRWHIYYSPNATPWAATFAIGPGLSKKEKLMAKIHKFKFGNKLQEAETYVQLRDAI